MRTPPRISLVIPALDERESLPLVLGDLPRSLLHEIIVVDNGSTDGTGDVARALGARVIHEPRRGYGRACLTGLAEVDDPDIVAFVDADYSDHPDELTRVVAPILRGEADLVIGSRARGDREAGALLPQARYGNLLAVTLIDRLCGVRFTDLGPFRAIGASGLARIGMVDEDFGWTVEMQVKAARAGLRCVEVPVSYRCRVGVSKITGTLRGTVLAGRKILLTIARYHRWSPAPVPLASESPCITAVIPTLDEETEIAGCLDALAEQEGPLEVVVADGGSRDATRRIAAGYPGVRVLPCDPGRAKQMNVGAREARGDLLWFLHADCRPPPEAAAELRATMRAPWMAGGAFRFALRSERGAYRILEEVVRRRCDWFREPYGDQGIFARARVFHDLGGFPDIPLLEDLKFVKRLRRAGGFRQLRTSLPTSARRWEEHGILRTMGWFWWVAALERMGIVLSGGR